jgi:hypothetical protein
MVDYESKTEKEIKKLAGEMKEHRKELSPEDKEYIKGLKVVNTAEIEEPWKHPKWHDEMRRLGHENRRKYMIRVRK